MRERPDIKPLKERYGSFSLTNTTELAVKVNELIEVINYLQDELQHLKMITDFSKDKFR